LPCEKNLNLTPIRKETEFALQYVYLAESIELERTKISDLYRI
jgi:hypothetical protein